MTTKTSIITILHGEEEFIDLIKSNYNNFLDKDSLELVIVDDGDKNLIHHFSDLDNVLYLHLSQEEVEKFTTDFEVGKTKTASQRLRAVLYRVWEQGDQKYDFVLWYESQMERIINKYKSTLEV